MPLPNKIATSPPLPASQVEEKTARVKRSNIPKATIIDRRTGEPIDNSPKFISDFSREHAEDKEIVQRINKILIEGDWSYSSLLGKENQTASKL